MIIIQLNELCKSYKNNYITTLTVHYLNLIKLVQKEKKLNSTGSCKFFLQ